MFTCLLVGITLATIMVTSIPIYTRGNLQKTLQSDMEKFKAENNIYPGSFSVTSQIPTLGNDSIVAYLENFKKRSDDIGKELNVPVLSKKLIASSENLDITGDGKRYKTSEKYKLEAVNQLERHIKIVKGRLYSNTSEPDKTYEVIVSNSTFNQLSLVLNKVYYLYVEGQEPMLKVRVVGVYEPKDEKDSFWLEGQWKNDDKRFLIDYKLYTSYLIKNEKISVKTAEVDYALDYKKFNIVNYKKLKNNINSYVNSWSNDVNLKLNAPFINIFDSYSEKTKSVQTILWILEAPVFIILILYAAMVAKLIVDEEKNEISVLQSRGVSTRKILLNYFLEGSIASVIAIAVGPPIGMGMCKVLGITLGFLNFKNRKPIFTSLILSDYKYSLIAIGVFIVTIMVPVSFACRKNIIMRKNEKAKRNVKAIWQKYYFDVVLFSVSIYGLKNYDFRQKLMSVSRVNVSKLPVDPGIYVLTTLFIFSIGLLFLRVYPLIIRAIFKVGEKLWPPSIYASLVNVGRNNNKNQFIMIFIILTIAIGIFDMKCARTINSTIENKTRYLAGADVVMKAHWDKVTNKNLDNINEKVEFFQEPSYAKYSKLAGVKQSTKVFRTYNAKLKSDSDEESSNIYLMGITTNEFGKTAWFDPSLMKNHWYEYLNLMAKNPKAVLVSDNFANDYGVKPGDRINLSWKVLDNGDEENVAENGPIEFVIYGVVNYWPTYNPKSEDTKDMVVANLQYLQAKLPMDKYEVWIKKDLGNSTKLLYTDIKNKKLKLDYFVDTENVLMENLYSAGAQDINAVFNLCFIAIIIVTALAFLIYWTLEIKSRILQFGILRAMGMNLKKIVNMIFCEQILISVVSMIVGILIGNITCKVFLPLLNIVTNSQDQILPLKLISFTGDIINFSIILIIIFLIVLLILAIYVSKIKIDQAIKLGED